MLGRDHALFSGLAVAAGDPLWAHLTHTQMLPPGPLAVGALCAAGFGLLPDIDEPHSTVSRKLGFLSRGVSEVTNKLAGGHRMATHSLLASAAVFAAVFYGAAHPLGAAIIVGCAAALSLRLLLPKHLRYIWGAGLLAPAAIAYAVYASSYAGLWLAVCATTGYTFPLLGDACTVEGVPFAFPLSRHKMALPLLGHTDSTREQVVGASMCLGLLAALIFFSAMPAIQHLLQTHSLRPM